MQGTKKESHFYNMTLISMSINKLPLLIYGLPEIRVFDSFFFQQVNGPVQNLLQGKFEVKVIVSILGNINRFNIYEQVNIAVLIKLVRKY